MVPPKRQRFKTYNGSASEANGHNALSGKKQKLTHITGIDVERKKSWNSLSRHRGPTFVLVQGQVDKRQHMASHRPSLVPVGNNIVDISAGGMHTVCLTDNGEVYTFGHNYEGALGRATSKKTEHLPDKVSISERVVRVSAGASHSAALTDDGKVFIWGNFRDSKGSMGVVVGGQYEANPVQILSSVRIQKIASGCDHFVALSYDGHIYTSGCGDHGQLGRVARYFASRGGRRGIELLLTPGKVNIPKIKKYGAVIFDDIWAGACATFARAKDTGNIYACGLNDYRQIEASNVGVRFNLQIAPSFLNRKWQKISCGLRHTLTLDESGQVHILGGKKHERFDLQQSKEAKESLFPISTIKRCIDISCGMLTSYAVRKSGQVYSWDADVKVDDRNLWKTTLSKIKIKKQYEVVAVSGGGQHAAFLAVYSPK